eukprot:5550525-Pyramimonas_sp.AAC.1
MTNKSGVALTVARESKGVLTSTYRPEESCVLLAHYTCREELSTPLCSMIPPADKPVLTRTFKPKARVLLAGAECGAPRGDAGRGHHRGPAGVALP